MYSFICGNNFWSAKTVLLLMIIPAFHYIHSLRYKDAVSSDSYRIGAKPKATAGKEAFEIKKGLLFMESPL